MKESSGRQEIAKNLRRRQLIEATLQTIGKVGYASATLTQVAQEAGLSPSIVNFYFRSKDQLLIATLEHIVAEYELDWRSAVAKGRISPAAGLDAIIELDFAPKVCNPQKISVWYAFWAEALNKPSYREAVARLEDAYTKETCALVERLIVEGGYQNLDARRIALGLNALIDGLWFDCLIDPKTFGREQAKATCRLFLAGLFPAHFAAPRAENAPKTGEVVGLAHDQLGREAHRARLAAALRKRIEPLGPMRKEVLAAGLGVGARAIDSWIEGSSEPSSWQMGRIMTLLGTGMWMEVYGPMHEEMSRLYEARLAEALRWATEERAALATLREGGDA
ncbi:MAG TPA: transcriptional regulator BetI [Dongiaceae bacterium]|jgi:TetR/AcrR family transcriptional repressor of bet genes|nr:transcriptional regulator BetI [Dongiaceae bacterium]